MKNCKVCGKKENVNGSRRCRVCYNTYYREYRKKNWEAVNEIQRESMRRRRGEDRTRGWKEQANRAVKAAVARGILARRPCEKCGLEKSQAHHDSYVREKWLNVRWLCQVCHSLWHRMNVAEMPKLVGLPREVEEIKKKMR